MHLSATRNRIIRINLGVTVASFALTACIVPASFFGMNLSSGLGEHPFNETCMHHIALLCFTACILPASVFSMDLSMDLFGGPDEP